MAIKENGFGYSLRGFFTAVTIKVNDKFYENNQKRKKLTRKYMHFPIK